VLILKNLGSILGIITLTSSFPKTLHRKKFTYRWFAAFELRHESLALLGRNFWVFDELRIFGDEGGQ